MIAARLRCAHERPRLQPRRSIVDEFNRRVTLVIALVAIVVVGLNYEISLR